MIKKSSSSLDDFFSLPHRSIKNRFFLEFLLSPPMRNPTTHVSSYLLYICIIVAQHDPRFYSFLLTICPCLRLYSCVALLLLRSSFFLDCFSRPDSSDFVFDSIFISSYFFFSLPSTFFFLSLFRCECTRTTTREEGRVLEGRETAAIPDRNTRYLFAP